MLNPFALFLYLKPLMQELDEKRFYYVLFKASFISFGIYLFFVFTGSFLFRSVFNIDFESFRIFGGIIIFSIAYLFIIQGKKAFISIKSNLDDLASEIALPFMIGAGTISISIVMSFELGNLTSVGILTMVMVINFMIIYTLKSIRDGVNNKKFRIAFDKNMEILLRLNGFFLGAIGIDMIISGINNIYFYILLSF